jgi:hypothetical protein
VDQLGAMQICLIIACPLYLLLCGALGAYASTEHGRAATEGFWFGVLMGPLGVVAAACMPTRGKQAEGPELEDEEVDVEKMLKRAK